MGTKLAGRRVVITGVSRGVGFETAKRFLGEGARILGVARDPARLARAAETLSSLGDFAGLPADLCDAAARARVAGAVRERWGALDVLLNNAASSSMTASPRPSSKSRRMPSTAASRTISRRRFI